MCSRVITPGILRFTRGISSNGRALALHARGNGIDTRILHSTFHSFPCHNFFLILLGRHRQRRRHLSQINCFSVVDFRVIKCLWERFVRVIYYCIIIFLKKETLFLQIESDKRRGGKKKRNLSLLLVQFKF